MNKRLGLAISVFILALAVFACDMRSLGLNSAQTNSTSAPSRPTFAKNGDLAPEINLKSMTGDQIVLSQLEGRSVLVNFWATWCGPCREEFPALGRAYKKYKDQGFVVIGVNFQDENSDEGVLTFMRNSVVTFPIVRDTGERVGRMYNVRGLPTSFFVDKTGVIRDTVVGAMDSDIIEEELAKLLP